MTGNQLSGRRRLSAPRAMRCAVLALVAALASFAASAQIVFQDREAAIERLADAAGRLLVVGFHGRSPSEPQVRALGDAIAAGRVGGVILLGRNVSGPDRLRALVAYLQGRSPRGDLIVMIDQEGGRVARLGPSNGFRAAPSARDVARRSPAAAAEIYRAMAAELADMGVTVNLGPVVDLATEPRNRVIVAAGRSFGAAPAVVAQFAGAFVDAHAAAGVGACLKHFPGHGASIGDTHDGPTRVGPLWRADEALRPYAALIATGRAGCVMTSHLDAPELTGRAGAPVTFSAEAVSRLRRDLGFRGVVVTDDMLMGAARAGGPFRTAAARALAAGHDLILVGDWRLGRTDHAAAFREGVREALLRGSLAPWAVEASLAERERFAAERR